MAEAGVAPAVERVLGPPRLLFRHPASSGREELNLHGFTRRVLSAVRLPVTPRPVNGDERTRTSNLFRGLGSQPRASAICATPPMRVRGLAPPTPFGASGLSRWCLLIAPHPRRISKLSKNHAGERTCTSNLFRDSGFEPEASADCTTPALTDREGLAPPFSGLESEVLATRRPVYKKHRGRIELPLDCFAGSRLTTWLTMRQWLWMELNHLRTTIRLELSVHRLYRPAPLQSQNWLWGVRQPCRRGGLTKNPHFQGSCAKPLLTSKPGAGLAPATSGIQSRRSTLELPRHKLAGGLAPSAFCLPSRYSTA